MTVLFKGFPDGAQVSIGGVSTGSAGWGNIGSLPVWDASQSAGVSVTINVHRTAHQVAPDPVFYSLTLAGFDTNTNAVATEHDTSFGDKLVYWDYGEGYDFTAPAQVIALDTADGGDRQNARYSFGPLGSHVHRAAGSHTIRVAVVEISSGKIGQGSVTLNVNDPDVVYAGSRTLFVDTNGSGGGYPNSPSGATNHSSLATAFTALDAATSAPHRIVLERSQTHTITSGLNFNLSGSNGNSLRVEGREGSGSKALIDATGATGTVFTDNSRNSISGGTTGTCLTNFDILGPYDPTTNTGAQLTGVSINGNNGAEHVLIDRIGMEGMFACVEDLSIGNDEPDRILTLCDNLLDGWGNVGFFGGQGSIVSFLGCAHVQKPLARMYINGGATLGPMRFGRGSMAVMMSCDMFSSNGWSDLGDWYAGQPGNRFAGSPTSDGNKYCITGNVLEALRIPLAFRPMNTSVQRRLVSALVSGNVMISGFQGDRVVDNAYGGVTYRDNQLVMAGTHDASADNGSNVSPSQFIRLYGGTQGPTTNETAPIIMEDNTYVNLTGTSMVEYADTIGFSSVTNTGNLVHQPNAGGAASPLPTSTPAVTPRVAGYTALDGTHYSVYATPIEAGYIVSGSAGADLVPSYVAP